MAKSKQDYVAEGARARRMGNTRTADGNYFMPEFGTGDSWQAQAFAAGFNAEDKAMRPVDLPKDVERGIAAHIVAEQGQPVHIIAAGPLRLAPLALMQDAPPCVPMATSGTMTMDFDYAAWAAMAQPLPFCGERFVHAKRARILRRRGECVRYVGKTETGKAVYAWSNW